MTDPAPLDWRRQPTGGDRLLIIFRVVATFALLGPPLGALTFSGLFWLNAYLRHSPDFGPDMMHGFGMMALMGVPMSYVIGGLPATITGAGFAVWQAFRGPVSFSFAAAFGLACALGVGASGHWLLSEGAFPDRSQFALLLLTCLVPTLICWSITRNAAIAPPQETP